MRFCQYGLGQLRECRDREREKEGGGKRAHEAKKVDSQAAQTSEGGNSEREEEREREAIEIMTRDK